MTFLLDALPRRILVVAWLGACGRPGLPGLTPDAELPPPPAVRANGRFHGAALGWTLGNEVHLFVADSAFTQRVYQVVVRPELGDGAPATLDSAFGARRVLPLAADRLSTRRRDSGYFDATILHRGGAVPAALELIRLHRPGDCGAPGAVTELVYSFSRAAIPAVPPSRTSVAALFRSTASLRPSVSLAPVLDRDAARRLAVRLAQAAERVTANGPQGQAEPLTRRLALDPDLAADAGEVFPVTVPPGTRPLPRYAVAVRARFRAPNGDTVFVSAVAVTDSALARPRWVMRPVRARLRGGLLSDGVRYVLRGIVLYPPSDRELLLVDRIADVETRRALALVVDPWSRRLIAAQPLALRCR